MSVWMPSVPSDYYGAVLATTAIISRRIQADMDAIAAAWLPLMLFWQQHYYFMVYLQRFDAIGTVGQPLVSVWLDTDAISAARLLLVPFRQQRVVIAMH